MSAGMNNLKINTYLSSTCKDYLQVQLANRQVVVVRFFRTTQKIVYAVRTQLRYLPRILNPSNSIGLKNKLIILNTLDHG
jgi:hypothetical protein